MNVATIHPDDLLFFNEVSAAMWRVAKHYGLPLRSITHLHMPTVGMADRLGECTGDGHIRLVMRATVDGKWVDAPRTPDEVWGTAAHELAHLRHMNHGTSFKEFALELGVAIREQKVDHRTKVLDKLIKLQAQREGEAKLGNMAAAESFAAMINKLLIAHELNPSDIDYARATDKDPVIELSVDLSRYRIQKVRSRVAWQEHLARVVAHAHLCKFLIRVGTNHITFVGTHSHATVAEYAYGVLVKAAHDMSIDERLRHNREVLARGGSRGEFYGFREAWLAAFVSRISERFEDARKAAVAEAAPDVPGGSSTALIRLNGALTKAQKYVDDKFNGRRGRGSVSGLGLNGGHHAEGRRRGRAAADNMTIGRKALHGTATGTRGLLK